MQYWLAVRPDGVAIAGLCTLDIPETKTSVHIIAFYRPEARTSNANYGLIEYWFQDALAKGWNYLDFDVFRGPGDPRRWNGFSRFKGQFGTRFIIYRNPLMRFAK
jgi:lipid II:glycine glycyltransferase (peptidoglycan interpeptide bridge formation enzyme)